MSKYKFSLNSKIKSEIEWQLEHYPEDRRQLEQFKADMIPSATASYSLTGGVSGSHTHRNTEDVATRIVSNQYIRYTEWWCCGIAKALSHFDANDMALIDLVYWKRTHTPVGAGYKVGMTRSTAYDHINSILCAIALEVGKVSI